MLSWILVTFSRASASAQRLNEVFETEDTSETERTGSTNSFRYSDSDGSARNSQEPRTVQGAVEFRGVGFSYPNSEIQVLEDISFSAKAGERIAIMGATGSGKSSLVQLIPRLYTEEQGEIRIDAVDASELDLPTLRKSIGYVPQEVVLFTGSVRDNIAWGREDATMEEIVEAAKRAQIHETIEYRRMDTIHSLVSVESTCRVAKNSVYPLRELWCAAQAFLYLMTAQAHWM